MNIIQLSPDSVVVEPNLVRVAPAKSFVERLQSSIATIGLAEPIKVAENEAGEFVLIDGHLRLACIKAIRRQQPGAFPTIPAYVFDYAVRYEIRLQTDIYQDLLPSQLATLVEHLHESEGVRKADIARYIGVSPATLRNYTGLARLIQRGGYFKSVVDLMDLGVMPASNPYAWLRLNADGLGAVLAMEAAEAGGVDRWLNEVIEQARRGVVRRYTTAMVEDMTGGLEQSLYRVDTEARAVKKSLGLRRASNDGQPAGVLHARERLAHVREQAETPVLRNAARSFERFLR